MKSLVSPQMAVRALIKARPLAVGLLDKRNVRFWDTLDFPVGDIVRRDALGEFLDEMAYARIPSEDTDWASLPLYHLADFLTENHRGFLLHDISEIRHLLDIHTLADSAESAGLRDIQKAFQDFTRELQAHLDEEEGWLFPKILRYEACLRDGQVHPEFHRGSIQEYMAIRMNQEEKRLCQGSDAVAERIRLHAQAHADSYAARELIVLLDAMRRRLIAHGDLETGILFPKALEMERKLYNLSINGSPAVAYRRRGPMDSGILRLEDA